MTIKLGSKLASRVRKGVNNLLLDGLPLVCWTILHGYQDMLDLLWLDEVIVHSRLHSQLYNELDDIYSTKWDGQVSTPSWYRVT